MSSEAKAVEKVQEEVQEKVIILKSDDGEEFEVNEVTAAKESEMIKDLIEADCANPYVPLPNVMGPVLAKVVEYWNRHSAAAADAEEVRRWESEFLKGMGRDEMFEIMMAANYLNAQALLDLTCQAVADKIKNMTVEDVRDYFGIENDFTPEEEAKIRQENSWAFE